MPNDGGPAFPFIVPPSEDFQNIMDGMSLRDWFAGQALAAFRADHPPSHVCLLYTSPSPRDS